MKINAQFFHDLTKKRYLEYIESIPTARKEQVRTYATVILTIFAFSFFGIFAIGPTLSTITNLQKQLEDNTYVNNQLDTKLNSLSSLQQNYNLLSSDLSVLSAAIPHEPQVPYLAGQIQALAVESGVSLLQIKSSEVEIANVKPKTDTTSPFQLSIDVTGNYSQLSSFYTSLVSFERIITLETVTIARTKDGTDVLRLSIKAKGYYQP